MSNVDVFKLSTQEVAELACTYATLILYDDGQDVTSEKITSLIEAAGVKVEAYWPKLFAKAIAGKDIAQFFNFASSGPAPAPQAAVAKEAPKDDKKAGKKEVKKPEPKEE